MKNKIFISVLKLFMIIFILIFIFFPILYSFIFSTFDTVQEQVRDNNTLIISNWSFQNYTTAIKEGYWKSLIFSFVFAIVLVAFRIIICGMAGYALSRKSLIFKKTIFFILLFVSVFPENVLLVGLLGLFNSWDLNSYMGKIFMLSAPSIFSMFTILLFRNAFMSITDNEQKIMLLDNLSLIKKISVVYLPKMNIALTLTIIIGASSAWNSYLWPSIALFNSSEQTLATWVFSIGNLPSGDTSMGTRMAGTILYILPITIIYTIIHPKVMASFKKI
ncbi:hypothetical protein [Candidatus Mycoplasma mahonii]|uniref:hypothetical protein n=1 Tax=Candidatus Mycoplasma mahonii TaxID=3004105 RepID=UPI0026F1CC5D|nr:hypothetical protein [Candidatus Mycoplasma mahonii]WKX02181.1 hypothetical protein O3I44_02140 [Candidatus Mycoplasma mahonii]